MFSFLTPAVQNLLALALVVVAAAWLIARALRRKKKGACGCSSCPSNATAGQSSNADFIPLDEVLSGRN